METKSIRVYWHGYLVAKTFCAENEVDRWIANYQVTHKDDYVFQVNNIGEW